MFRIGQKVTQITPLKWKTTLGEVAPQFGVVYTIRDIIIRKGDPFLHFYEIRNVERQYGDGIQEMSFRGKWFRPIVDKATDISIFTAMLKPKKERV